MSRMGMTSVAAWGTLAFAAAACLLPGVASAQPPRTNPVSYTRDQARQSIEDLTNGFMEDFTLRRTNNGTRPMPSNPTQATPEMKAVRPILKDVADELSQLSYELNDELRRLPNIRPLLNDAMKVSALAVSLDKHAQRYNDHQLLLEELQELDATWRELAYRLDAVRGLSKPVRDRIASLKGLDEEVRDAIGIRPQVNRRELVLKTNDLAQDIRNLSEDVQVELPGADGRQYLLTLSRARQQVLNIASLIDDPNGDMEMITNEYRKFQTIWYPQRTKLQEYDNRYFERSLRRITQADGEIHQLLLLPTKVDSSQLVYLTSALKKDIDDFFDRMSLKLLMHLPKADRVAGVASEFYGVCEHFIDEVNHGVGHDQLVDSFRYIEQAQRSFSSVFNDIESDEALAALQTIERTITALGDGLQIQRDQFNRREAADLSVNIETITEELEYATKRWLTRDRQPFSRDCLAAIAQLKEETLQLNQDIIAGSSTANLRPQMESIYNLWRECYGYLVKCQSQDRPTLGRLSARLTPAMVELRTMLAQ